MIQNSFTGPYLPAAFRGFVEALGRHGCRAIRRIEFYRVEWQRLRDADTALLFGDVLPTHPTLVSITFCLSHVPFAPLLKLFARAVPAEPTSPLKELAFRYGAFGRECAGAVADLIRRNVPLSSFVGPSRMCWTPSTSPLRMLSWLRRLPNRLW